MNNRVLNRAMLGVLLLTFTYVLVRRLVDLTAFDAYALYTLAVLAVVVLLLALTPRRLWQKVAAWRWTPAVLLAIGAVTRVGAVCFFGRVTPKDDAIRYMGIAERLVGNTKTYHPTLATLIPWLLGALFLGLLASAIFVYVKRATFCRRTKLLLACLPLAAMAAAALLGLVAKSALPQLNYPGQESSIFPHYIAVFPHFLGYPAMVAGTALAGGGSLSVVAAAQVVNILLGTGCVWLVYCIASKLCGRTAGVGAMLLYVLWPAQWLYAALPLAEVPYTFLLLLTLYCITLAYQSRRDKSKLLLFSAYAGVACAVASAVRPLAALILVAYGLWLLTALIGQWKDKALRYGLIGGFALLLVINIAGGAVTRSVTTHVIGRQPASFAMGWNMLDGSNHEALGTWNAEDNKLFTPLYKQVIEGTLAPDALHHQLFDIGVQRYTDNGLSNIKFFAQKVYAMWKTDELGLTYSVYSAGMPQTELFTVMRGVCGGYYLALLLAFILLSARCIIKGVPRFDHLLFLPLLYVGGTVAAHMVLEQAQRYTFPTMSLLAIGVAGLCAVLTKERQKPS